MNRTGGSASVHASADAREIVSVEDAGLRYGRKIVLDRVSLTLSAGRSLGVIGPDGVGKSSLLGLIAGARRIRTGTVRVLGGDMANRRHRQQVCPRIAYMPQGLGRNLYPTLSVRENVDFFGRLFGEARAERNRRIPELLRRTGLAEFADRPVGKLSGGMKQKLGLCCALIHDPDLLVLDEPTTGVDPLSRKSFWELIERIRHDRPEMSLIVATAYMEEAARFDTLAAMDDGRIIAAGAPRELLEKTGARTLEEAYVRMLPERKRGTGGPFVVPPHPEETAAVAIEADGLTVRFGDFTAVDGVSFRIRQGEIFGFLGSNGCGKTTTMKVLTGLLPASAGKALIFGTEADARSLAVRRRVGYMSQSFSLYSELTVGQNLRLHARLYDVPRDRIEGRIDELARRLGLEAEMDTLPERLPLGQRQRLSLAVALVHSPDLLILDEPTSGVDPVARDLFWRHLVELSRRERVTIFISTHYVDEASRCDRVSLMHAGKVLESGTPEELIRGSGAKGLEDAFVRSLEKATADEHSDATPISGTGEEPISGEGSARRRAAAVAGSPFSFRRLGSYALRETLELRRDPLRGTLAVFGSVILLFILGYGISFDVENLTFAVLDFDRTTASEEYALNLSGSRYFERMPDLTDYADMDRRMIGGELGMAVELPPGFGREIGRGSPVRIGVWIDGAMPQRAETIRSYVQGMHLAWLAEKARESGIANGMSLPAEVAVRFRYNPEIKSIVAMVPAVIPILLLLIPAMMTALAVAREKEMGSIVNSYVTPVTRLEFVLGKQLPYVVLGMLNFGMLTIFAVAFFEVPLKGSLIALAAGALSYLIVTTALGLLISTFTRSQVGAIFGTAILTMMPATQFSGLLDPVSSLEGAGAFIGAIYPTSHFLDISRGAFSKALGFAELRWSFVPLLVAIPTLTGLTVLFLPKQEA